MSRRKNIYLHAVGFVEGREWAAICLETGYLGYGKTFDAALTDLVEATQCALLTVRAQRLPHTAILSGPQAPRRYWSMYERASRPLAVFPVAA